MKQITIAIDGYSSCGKSTMAKDLAQELGYTYIDTGAMYRAVTLFAMRNRLISNDNIADENGLKAELSNIGISQRNINGQTVTFLNDEDVENEIRSLDVSSHVSVIAALPFVREKLVEQQRKMGEAGGIVMDGRDIGTVVFPNAEMKVFVTASAEVRAKRRYLELQQKGMPADYNDILQNVQERDYIDSHRSVSPLRQAQDAVVLDNSTITIAEQRQWLLNLAANIIGNKA